jgi:histidinol-phosphate aminotransferase
LSKYLRRALGSGPRYAPGEVPPDDTWARLNTNEAPLAPSPLVSKAFARAGGEDLHRYPHAFGEPLRGALAAHHGVAPNQIIVGNGADQVLTWCFRAFAEPGLPVVMTSPAYGFLESLTAFFGCVRRSPSITPDGRIPEAFTEIPAPLRFLVNPSAWTGSWVPAAEIEALVAGVRGVVVIDEAYVEFAPESCLPLLSKHPNCLIVRTFSKSYALAGARVGYAIGSPELIADLAIVKDPSPVGRLALSAAAAALEDQPYHKQLVDMVCREREIVTQVLRERGWRVWESYANCVLALPPDGEALSWQATLRRDRILVRHTHWDGEDWLRITVGSANDNQRLLASIARAAQ